jgi:hypothetical protein
VSEPASYCGGITSPTLVIQSPLDGDRVFGSSIELKLILIGPPQCSRNHPSGTICFLHHLTDPPQPSHRHCTSTLPNSPGIDGARLPFERVPDTGALATVQVTLESDAGYGNLTSQPVNFRFLPTPRATDGQYLQRPWLATDEGHRTLEALPLVLVLSRFGEDVS